MAKGPQWERDLCHSFSKWWSKRGDDDLFWRTHGSGARATVRTKKGKKTRGHYGDMAATDSRGATLTKVFTFSFKRGYKTTFQNLVDALDNKNRDGAIPEQEYAGWIREAMKASLDAGTQYWCIIIRRDKRKAIILLPAYFFIEQDIKTRKKLSKITPQVSLIAWVMSKPPLTQKDKEKIKKEMGKKKGKKYIRKYIKRNNKRRMASVIGYPLDDFLEVIDRSMICQIHKRG
jgi:hypothetical protein